MPLQNTHPTPAPSATETLSEIAESLQLLTPVDAVPLSYGFANITHPIPDAMMSSPLEVGVESARGQYYFAGILQRGYISSIPRVLRASHRWSMDSDTQSHRLSEVCESHKNSGEADLRREALVSIRGLALAIATESLDVNDSTTMQKALEAVMSYYDTFRYTNTMLTGQRFAQLIVRLHGR